MNFLVHDIRDTARRFLVEEDGAFLIEFGITFPILILLSFGLLEFSLVVFDYQRAAEATRRGVRRAVIIEPIANTTNLLNDSVITCSADGDGVVSCTGGSVADAGANTNFADIMSEMQKAYPTLTNTNLTIVYEGTQVGDVTDSGGVFPLITIKLQNVVHKMIVGHLIGVDELTFPEFTTTVLGNGKWVNVSSGNNSGKN